MSPSETEPPAFFKQTLKLFHRAAKDVPAYKDFLLQHKVDPLAIQDYPSFQKVPPITKENYLKQYPLTDLLWHGTTEQARVISMSSGSSGTPFFWIRGNQSAADAIVLHDEIFTENFETRQKNTLCIIAFAMGSWIAGTYTLAALQGLADLGHQLVCITPGINKAEILHILQSLSPQFEQTIIAGYPPFVKDCLDEADEQGIDLPSLHLKVLLAGENYSEHWRSYLENKMKNPSHLPTSIGIYGTADAGMLGHENALSIYARKIATTLPELSTKLFNEQNSIPSLVAYNPKLRFFECAGTNLIFSVNNCLPLLRYQILDQGNLIAGNDLAQTLEASGHPLPPNLKPYTKSHYLALYGRTDVSTTFYALDIYPENIRAGLEEAQIGDLITGKFVLKTEYNAKQQQSLHLYVELRRGQEASEDLRRTILTHVVRSLRRLNSEYNKVAQELKEMSYPHIHLQPHGAPDFHIVIKHRWTVLP